MKCGSYYETVLIWLWVVLCNSACVKLLWSSWLLILTKILTSIISPALQTNTPHQKLDLIDKYYCLLTLPRLHSHLSSWSFCRMLQPFKILDVVHIAEYLWVTSLEWTIYNFALQFIFLAWNCEKVLVTTVLLMVGTMTINMVATVHGLHCTLMVDAMTYYHGRHCTLMVVCIPGQTGDCAIMVICESEIYSKHCNEY